MHSEYLKIVFFALSIICIASLLLSCAGKNITQKPQKVIVQYNRNISDYNRLHAVDIVSYNSLPAQAKKILVQYNLSGETPPSDEERLLWNQAIQKTLLRNGFLIVQQAAQDDIFNEENTTPQYDALCIVDNISIQKHTDTVSSESSADSAGFTHTYSYYSATISASIAINQTIVWRGDVTITSFDVLTGKHIISQPVLHITVTTDYTYSKKLNKWIKEQPVVLITDNFSTHYTGSNITLHTKELVQLATSILFDTIKVAQ